MPTHRALPQNQRLGLFTRAACFLALFVFGQTFLILPGNAQEAATSAVPTSAPRPAAKPESTIKKRKVAGLEVSGSWRARIEGWNWFQGSSGDNDYAFMHSLLRLGVGQQGDRFDWKLEAAQDAILGLPKTAVAPGPQGQLGLGGTYFAANGNGSNNVNGFVKQAYIHVKNLGPLNLKLGRFEFIDGMELVPKDKTLGALVETRVAQRLIGSFGWSAVGRSIDGLHLTSDFGSSNLTFVGGRPTRGAYQIDGMGELNIDLVYGAYSRAVRGKNSVGRLRVFGIGYFDHRDSVLKTDNRPLVVRSGDHQGIQIGTFGAEYLEVFDLHNAGKFDVLGWGVVQTGSWGVQTHRAAAFFAEAGWQPHVLTWRPWLSAGFSYGSGDDNPNDSTHGTFSQILPTPRPYARFPFWNMQNNYDFWGALRVQPASKLSMRSELHGLWLANSSDLWYLGGGAFQPRTFGYTGRPSNGYSRLANTWDLSADYQATKSLAVVLYYGHAWGKSVIANIYPANPNGQFAYLETNLRF